MAIVIKSKNTSTAHTKDGKEWDRCRCCGRTWDIVAEESAAKCRSCFRGKKPIDPTIQPINQPTMYQLSKKAQQLILAEETKEKFGYYPADIYNTGTIKFVTACDVCGEPKDTTLGQLKQDKGFAHSECKSVKTHKTNIERYGTTNARNINLEERMEAKDQEITEHFDGEGYNVINIDRQGSEIVVEFICPRGDEHSITWSAWKFQNQRCGICFGNNGKITIGKVREDFEAADYILLTTEYKDQMTPLKYICPKGHKEETTWKYWQRGCRCPKCRPNISKGEQEVKDIFKEFSPVKTTSLISPFEIDIYFPDHKVAVEYCGLYYHSEAQERLEGRTTYHYNKMKMCDKEGVRLITLFEDEWQSNKEICVSRIKNALGVVEERIYARKCEIKEVPQDESAAFFRANHIQGSARGIKKTFGLYYNNELVYVLALSAISRPHLAKDKQVLEVKRMAPKLDTVVVGGASRLFKQTKHYAIDNKYDQILSYCDMRWGTGKVYEKLGMTLQSQSEYSTYLTDGTQKWRIQTFANKSAEEKKGLYKLYDCGNQTWIYDLV